MKTNIQLFHPFDLIGFSRPKIDDHWHPSDDLYRYGFSLNLTTECYFYRYDWGTGFNFRALGFGFELTWIRV